MTQKEFSKRTGIAETTVSDWKKKTNPTSDKIMNICKVLDVTPEWLLSGVEIHGTRSNPHEWYAIDAMTDVGLLVITYNSFDSNAQARLIGYAKALQKMVEENKKGVKQCCVYVVQ
ncbi:Transcriptional regulator, contains XRE-family HTH domain [Butyrivibrio fibrisolvens]|uniref:Transcriptional regulator, contains XRE-family HTH domain n=1 Tax=Butyrivibrio fibrisolvens TaxID=831 RepID=A0A1H9XC88_BUTFI|nr:helix-turn-helix transcriptional regulator [Butyrivibrio fibrisolvens]SES43806.1 Transcriptional regulator, contains XRE-family HTH domain [Butyrivibrio fibrisolvens]